MTLRYVAMERTIDQQLDGLLIDWWHWTHDYKHTRGYVSDHGTTGAYNAPGHMDWWNGAADERADLLQLRQFDAAVQRIPNEPHPWRLAIEFQARNLAQGIVVWFSPRLPPTRAERDVLLLEARNKLLLELRSEGVIG